MKAAEKKSMKAQIVVDPYAEMKKPIADWVKATPAFTKKFKPVKFEDQLELDTRKWSEKKLEKALYALIRYELQLFASQGADLKKTAVVLAGAIPVIRPLTQSLAGDTVLRVAGIVNGTTNYILSEMASTGADYASALADASALGYAEADPTADVEGYDAAAKAAILASIAFHTRITADDVYREGITKVSPADFAAARALDCTIKLLAICERITGSDGQERVSARVYPALVPLEHPLATVNGAFNAVVVEAEAAGRLMFYGQGAGGNPTASAVMGDVVMAARNRVHGGRGPRESKYAQLPIAPIGIIPHPKKR